MPTRKTLFWLLAAAAFYLIAWNVGSGWLYMLSGLMVAVPAASLLLGRLNTRGTSVMLEMPGQTLQGDDAASRLVVENRSRLPRFLLRSDISIAGSTSSVLLPQIGSRDRVETTMVLEDLDRGIYTGPEVTLSSSAPFGLAMSRRRLTVSAPMAVYPRWHRLAQDWDAGQRDTGYVAVGAMPTRHSASDYLGVREYRPGDSPRAIHWRTTARSGKLTVIEYARLAAMTPVVILDTYSGADINPGRKGTFEAAVSLAASLIQREAGHNRRFGLGSSVSEAVERGLGHQPEPPMLWLAQVRPDSAEPLDLDSETLPWAGATPVLVLTSHHAYADAHRSGLMENFPQTIIIMLDGRGFSPGRKESRGLMDDAAIERLAGRIEAGGGRFLLVPSLTEMGRCLDIL